MRVMLDTNILVSLIFFPSTQTDRLFNCLTTKHQIIISDYVIDELRLVVKRKFASKWPYLNIFFHEFPFEFVFTPQLPNFDGLPQVRDKKDTPILATALLEDVDVFITGDKDFLALDTLKRPDIMTISQFIERFC